MSYLVSIVLINSRLKYGIVLEVIIAGIVVPIIPKLVEYAFFGHLFVQIHLLADFVADVVAFDAAIPEVRVLKRAVIQAIGAVAVVEGIRMHDLLVLVIFSVFFRILRLLISILIFVKIIVIGQVLNFWLNEMAWAIGGIIFIFGANEIWFFYFVIQKVLVVCQHLL